MVRLLQGICFITLVALVQCTATWAQEASPLDAISKFASQNCEEVQQSGGADSEKIKGQVQAGISGLLKRFANAEGAGDVERSSEHYTGLVQGALPEALKDVRDCKQHIIDLLVPMLLPKKAEIDGDTRILRPGDAMMPRNTCSGSLPPDALVLLLGSNAFFSDHFPYVIIEVKGKSIVTVDRSEDGSLIINMDVIGTDGRLIASVVRNKLVTNVGNLFRLSQDSPHQVSVVGQDRTTEMNFEYINSQTLRVTGQIRYANFTIPVDDAKMTIGSISMSGMCIGGGRAAIGVQ